MKKNIEKRMITAGISLLLALCSIYSCSIPAFAAQPEKQEAVQETESGTSAAADSTAVDSTETAFVSVITSVAPLAEEDAEIFFDDKPTLAELTGFFPQELSVFLEGTDSPAPLPVTWECSDDYENTEFDVYEFTPVWDTDAYPFDPSFDSFADMPYITVYVQQSMASVRLLDAAEAQADLNALVKNKDVYALLYLCDTYEIKQQPGKAEATAASISTGQSVRITGVGEDASCNIWYQISVDIGGSSYNGYIERNYLAYADEDLLAWESRWISGQTYRMASPAVSASDGLPSDVAQFPASYQSGLLTLKTSHPNWIFVKMNTDLDWNTAVQEENKNSRSLISATVTDSWKKSSFDKSWAYPSDGILAYYMDPRNFLSENHIFQFELLSYNATYHSEGAVQEILNGTFMSGAISGDSKGQSYAQAFCSIAKALDVSPFHLASRVRQEQGEGTSPLISGTHPSYPGVYNYFNIGATGQGSAQVIENGLKKAAEYKWTTRFLSLEGGANIISKDYIRKGQNTLYLQKFNVSKTSPSGLYQHQYMQNIAAPSSEAVSVKKAYAKAGSLNNPFVFRIPVYKNMPSAACSKPAAAVTKTDPPYTLPVLDDITYAPKQTLADISLPSGWKWDDPSAVPTVSNKGYSATFTPENTDKYNTVKKTIALTVNKGTPAYTVPSGLQASVGDALSSVLLPSGFSWEDPSSVLKKEGKVSCRASYNPDTANYQTVTGIEVPVAVANPSAACTSHTYGEWTVTTPATCSTAGVQIRSCLSCGLKENENIPATGHDYSSKVTKEATEAEEGVRTYTCSKCQDSYTEAIAKLPPSHKHSYSLSISIQPSCTEKGSKTYSCSCGDSYSEEIPASGHDMDDGKCRRCGYQPEPDNGQEDNSNSTASNSTDSNTGSSSSNSNAATDKGSSDSSSSGKDNITADSTGTSSNGSAQAGSSSSSNGNTQADSSSSSPSESAQADSSSSSSSENAQAGSSISSSSKNAQAGSSSSPSSGSGKSNTTAPAASSPANKNITIDMTTNTVLYEETISSIRGRDIDVILNMGNSISWTITGSNIVADEANGIDMGITTEAGHIPDVLVEQASALSAAGIVIELSLAHDGPLDFHPILTINVAPENAGHIANLYYFNPDSEQLEFIEGTVIDENGNICFTFSHASDYVIIISETVMTDTSVITSSSSSDTESSPETPSEAVSAGDFSEEESSGINLPAILIIAVILITAVAIGLTAFFILRSQKETGEEEDMESEEDDDDEEDELWEEEDLSDLPDKKRKNSDDDFSLDEGDPDDYREPATHSPIGNRPRLEHGEFDDDEFDGFE